MHNRMVISLAALCLAAACNQDPTGASTNELVLAQRAQVIADNVAATPAAGTNYEGWLRRVVDTLRTTDDPEARADLAAARANRDSALTARQAGDTAAARGYARTAFRDVLAAIIELFPNAPERTGLAVDNAIDRIETFLGGRDAPRIRAILAHVKELRVEADQAFVAGDKVTTLALNLRGSQILHRLVEHVRENHRDHDEIADAEMNAVGY
ncbi:MAG: hypothetical protein ABR537_10045 [Gemmatimonadales bacterium]